MDDATDPPTVRAANVLPPGSFPILSLPLDYPIGPAAPPPSVAVLLHLYYEDLGPEMRDVLMRAMPCAADLYVTTDTEAKRETLRACFAQWPHGRIEVRLVPNRGRDVAPRVVELADLHERYELCLNLHGKKSPHWEKGGAWRRDQVNLLARSREVVAGIVEAFRRWPRLGLVMPRTFEPVRIHVNWGYDLGRCMELGRRLGINLAATDTLLFPAGSMFWTRRGALRPLLDLGLTLEDFEEEDGLPYGSMAHAIERLMLHVCERAGFHWLVVGNNEARCCGLERARSAEELDAIVASGILRLTDPADLNLFDAPGATETLRALYRPDRSAPTRLTLLLDHRDIEADAEPGSPVAQVISIFAAARSFASRRVALPARHAGSMLLREMLPACTQYVPLSRDGMATPLALGAHDVVITTGGSAAVLAERLRAAAGWVGEPPFRLWTLHAPNSASAQSDSGDATATV